jgi:tetratricopeptide (TPR) repeat protein
VEGRRAVFGPGHPVTLSAIEDLGLVARDQGRIDEAVALLRAVLVGMRAFHGTPYFHGGRYLCDELVGALREQGDWAAIRALCEGWLRELLELPPEPDPVVRGMKMVTLSCLAYRLAALPPDVPFDEELALRAAEQAAELGSDIDSNWTRLALVHLRLGQLEQAERALAESMARHDAGNPLDWMTRALIHAHLGDLGRSREAFDRAARADEGTGPGVGYADVRAEVAARLGMAHGAVTRPRGPSSVRNEGSPIPPDLAGGIAPGP